MLYFRTYLYYIQLSQMSSVCEGRCDQPWLHRPAWSVSAAEASCTQTSPSFSSRQDPSPSVSLSAPWSTCSQPRTEMKFHTGDLQVSYWKHHPSGRIEPGTFITEPVTNIVLKNKQAEKRRNIFIASHHRIRRTAWYSKGELLIPTQTWRCYLSPWLLRHGWNI